MTNIVDDETGAVVIPNTTTTAMTMIASNNNTNNETMSRIDEEEEDEENASNTDGISSDDGSTAKKTVASSTHDTTDTSLSVVTSLSLSSSTVATGKKARSTRNSNSNYSLYHIYELEVDKNQGNKAVEVVLCNFSRPHMRAFHFSWMCFFVAYVMWFGLAPLINDVRYTLKLTTEDIWTSHITSIGGALFLRLFSGPMCDQWGARLTMGWTLIAASIPTGLTGLARNSTDLAIFRFFSGFAGSTFVPCQYWTSTMFTKEVSGTANAIVAGWGNVGGGVAPLMMGSVLFPSVKAMGATACQAWRSLCAVPAVISIVMGILCLKYTDDSPKGYYKDLKRHGVMSNETTARNSFWVAAYDRNTWMLCIQYSMCLGVELTMNSATVLYLMDKHDMSTEQASAVASLFGITNLFARGLGGYFSDWANLKNGMRGRLMVQTLLLLGEGLSVWFFVHVERLASTVVLLIVFSLFVQATEGSTYGILPYVNPHVTGSVAGIVGAGGNVGAILFGVCFRQFNTNYYHWAFILMSIFILSSCICSFFIRIPGLAGLCCGQDCEEAIQERHKAQQMLLRNISQHGNTNTTPKNDSSSNTTKKKNDIHTKRTMVEQVILQDNSHRTATSSSPRVNHDKKKNKDEEAQ